MAEKFQTCTLEKLSKNEMHKNCEAHLLECKRNDFTIALNEVKLEFEKKISALKFKVENLEKENLALKTRQNSPVFFHAGLRSHITSADYQTLVFDETRYSSKVS